MKTIKIFMTVLVVFCLLFTACSSKVETSNTDKTTASADTKNPVSAAGGKIKDFLTKGGAYKCSYKITTPEGTATQTVFLDGKNMRSEMTTSTEKGKVVLVGKIEGTKQCSYMWGEGIPPTENDPGNTVIKVCVPAPETNTLNTDGLDKGSGSFSSIDWNAEADCSPYAGQINLNYPQGYELSELTIPTEAELSAGTATLPTSGLDDASMGDPIPPSREAY